MIDTTVLGETAAKCMESLDNHEVLDGGRVEAVLFVVVCQDAENSMSFTRVYSSETSYFKQRGLICVAQDCVMDGEVPSE